MNGAISVINSGSSSIKFSLYKSIKDQDLALVFRGQIDGVGVMPKFAAQTADGEKMAEKTWSENSDVNHSGLIAFIIDWIRENRLKLDLDLLGVGHRVVHGGNDYTRPVKVDESVLDKLEKFIPLAPLHQPHNIKPIRTIAHHYPHLPQVACFDTAFHTTNPRLHRLYALPRTLIKQGVYRYGFHGLSYEYIAQQLPQYEPELANGRVIVAHLGSGASMCGMLEGESNINSLGFTANEGLMMGTRTGSLDPGILLYLMRERQMDASLLEDLLYKRAGLLGVSEISNDMRILLETDDRRAKEAVDLFIHRIQKELGATAAVLGGLDVLVFTAGIGEKASEIRKRVCAAAGWLGVKLNQQANLENGPKISADDSDVSVWVIPTNEELMIARHTQKILSTFYRADPSLHK